jgi:UPF0755 protein
MRQLFFIGVIGGVVALLGFLALSIIVPQNRERMVIVVEQGARLSTVAVSLSEKGAIRHPRVFKAWAYFTRRQNSLRAGEYEIPARTSVRTILRTLVKGIGHNRFATVPEGLTAKQIKALFKTFDGLTGEMPHIKDGDIFPQTYAYIRGQTKTELVTRMKRDMDITLQYEWNNRAPGLPLRTPHEALVLASIIGSSTALEKT